MNTPARNFVLGLTSIGAIAGVVALLFFFGEIESLVRPRYVVTINCRNAAGLRAGSNIEFNGVPVGFVERILNIPDPERPVRVITRIDRNVVIPDNIVPFATSSLIGGAATMQLETEGPPSAQTLPRDGTAVLNEPIRSRLMEEISAEFDTRVQPLLSAMEEFERLARNLNDLMGPVAAGAPGNIRTAVERLNLVMLDVQEALALAKTWLGDDQLRADARAAVENAGVLISKASDTLDRLTSVAGTLETDAHTVALRLVEVMDDAAATLEEVRTVARLAHDGEGTVARMLQDADLYDNLDDAAIRLERALREVELLVQKVKAEGIPILWP